MLYTPGELLENLIVTDLTIDGKAVARHNGRVVFIDSGLPGEELCAIVTATQKRIVQASAERTLKASPHAVTPWCAHAAECGACSWQHFSAPAAREWKQKHVREVLTRIAAIADPLVFPLEPSPEYREYRNKTAFAFGPAPAADKEKNVLLGLRKAKEHAIVEVEHCGLQAPVVMRLLARVRQLVNSLGLEAYDGKTGYLRFLVVHTPKYMPEGKKQLLVECITSGDHEHKTPADDSLCSGLLSHAEKIQMLGRALVNEFELHGFVHSERRQRAGVAQGERTIGVLGTEMYQERFGHLLLTVPYNAFLQTNTDAAELLYARVAEEASLSGQEVLWDLYSGVGCAALYLAKDAREVHGFEVQRDAVTAARKNSEEAGYTHCRFHLGELSPASFSLASPPDIIVADPPRAGFSAELSQALLTSPARKLIYVSCDPGTLARDLARLSPAWSLRHCQPIDMFPYTPHVENIVVLERVAR